MTQKDRKLLIKDLCSRSYYKVKVSAIYDGEEYEGTLCAIYPEDNRIIIDDLNKPCHYPNQTCGGFIIDEHKVKPYLFPLSSMTSKQKAELSMLVLGVEDIFKAFLIEVEFYHKHHIDYRGLIPMGLAIDATGLNIY